MESDRKEIVVNGTLDQYKYFITSVIWRDLESNFGAWLEDIRDELEIQEDSRQLAVLQGNAVAIRRALNLPFVIMNQIREQLGVEELEDGEE